MQGYDKNTKKILNGATWLGLSAIILKVIGLIYKIPMSYLLGDEGMGYFNSAYTVYTFFYIIGSAGIPKAISILSAKSTAGEAKCIFSVIFKIYFGIGTFLSICLIILSKSLAHIISSESSAPAIFAIAPSIFFVCASGVLRGYLNGKTKFVPVAVSEMISGVFKLILGLVFAVVAIKSGFKLPIVCAFSILGITISSFFGFIYLLMYYKRESGGIKIEYLPKNKVIKDVFRIGLPIAFAAALSNLVNIIDLSVIMNRLKQIGYPESLSTTIYGNYTTLAVPMFSVVTNLLNTITLASLPIITKSFSERKFKELQSSANSSTKFSLFIAIPAFFVFLLFPYEILSAVFETGSATLGAAFLFCLSFGTVFYSLLMSANTLLEGTGRIKSAVTSLVIGAGIKSVLSFILIGKDCIGALGAPISTSISYIFSFLISIYMVNRDKKIKINIFENIKDPIIISLAAAVPSILVKCFLNNSVNVRLSSFIILFVFGIFYLVFSFFSTIKRKKNADLLAKCTKKVVSNY